MQMTITEFLVARAIAIAGSTFTIGLALGWILAILQFGNSSGSSHRNDRDED
jgi:hypothetical protein